jgi:hypothetical protein
MTTGCAETISRAAKATASTRFSLPLVTTSAYLSHRAKNLRGIE